MQCATHTLSVSALQNRIRKPPTCIAQSSAQIHSYTLCTSHHHLGRSSTTCMEESASIPFQRQWRAINQAAWVQDILVFPPPPSSSHLHSDPSVVLISYPTGPPPRPPSTQSSTASFPSHSLGFDLVGPSIAPTLRSVVPGLPRIIPAAP